MHVTPEDVRRVASLSQLEFSEEAAEKIGKDLDAVLGHIQKLNELDTEGVEPTSYILVQQNVLRPDTPGLRWPRTEMLANAPEKENGFFAVPKVVE